MELVGSFGLQYLFRYVPMFNSRFAMMGWRWLLLVTIAVAVMPAKALARPLYKKALADHFGPLLAKKLNDCRTCHLADAKEADGEKPHNAFGKRLVAVKAELRKAGKPTDIITRLEAIAEEDSDGDGVANLQEILAGRFPGDGADQPTVAELESAKKALLALANRKAQYPWRPFETVTRPAIPKVKQAGWAGHPVDAFLAAEQEKQGLKPRPEAARPILLRRLYLDLIGLPPTPEEIEAFQNDASANAYEKVVDQLLANPHYGERWGRHWMDIWRYSDWAGYGAEVRDSQPHIWRWRDWIVDALNADKPYDRMILEMLAGDELAPGDPNTVRATGFLVRNWYKFNRDVWLDRTVEHTSKAFLGVTLNCARCHDHFFDPFRQEEYYQFRAVFEAHDIRTDRVSGQLDSTKDGVVRVFDARPEAPTYLYLRGESHDPDKKKPLPPAAPAALGGQVLTGQAVALPPAVVNPDKEPWVRAALIKAQEEAVAQAQAALAQAKGKDLAQINLDLAEAKLAALQAVLHAENMEESAPQSEAHVKAAKFALHTQRLVQLLEARKNVAATRQGLAEQKGGGEPAARKKVEEAEAALQKVEAVHRQPLTMAYAKRPMTVYPATSTGRRLALARWIADAQNPLTARVAVNHMWLRHFGKALVPSVFDFGANGQPPSHPALLDWLAAEFMDKKWSMKHLHRLLVTSAAYRMDSTTDEANTVRDPENRHLWRMNARRMEAEIVRDSVLAVAGQLDRKMGGPEIDQNQGLTTTRRTLYYRYAPEKMMEFMTIFDSANVVECYQRTESVVPQQALAMANSVLVQAQARLLARQLAKRHADSQAFIKAGFLHVLGRMPTDQENSFCTDFLDQQKKLLENPKNLGGFPGGPASPVPPSPDPQLRARENLIHVLFNHNEFVTIR